MARRQRVRARRERIRARKAKVRDVTESAGEWIRRGKGQ